MTDDPTPGRPPTESTWRKGGWWYHRRWCWAVQFWSEPIGPYVIPRAHFYGEAWTRWGAARRAQRTALAFPATEAHQ